MGMPALDLILVHGAGGGGWEWRLWQGVLEALGHRVHAVDLQPAPDVAATRYEDYLAQVHTALRCASGSRVLVGASLGGLLAMDAVGAADALILVNPLPPAPWHAQLPARAWPDCVPWGVQARLSSTRRALPDADASTAIEAMRHWRDESGAVLRAAHAGRTVAKPGVPVLCIASRADEDVPPSTTRALSEAWGAELLVSGATSHVGALLGIAATTTARQAADWLQRRLGR